MANWFLIIIYLAFISLGLPDAMLGSAWPVMQQDLNAQLGAAGILSMIIAGGTILSSIFSGRLIDRFGTGKTTVISCFMTATALLGFSMAPTFSILIIFAVILGLGAGAVDSGLNNYVAENYEVHHMNWLHSFWGVGATAGPLLMATFIARNNSWRGGYTAASVVQFSLVLVLILTLPMWKKVAKIKEKEKLKENSEQNIQAINDGKTKNVFKIKGVKYSLVTFLFYCATEATVGLWGASYLVGSRNMTADSAARWVALYYLGITVGRMISGFVSMKISNRRLILIGQILSLIGILMLLLPTPVIFAQIGLVIIGLGLAPVFPGLLHETPKRFGKANSAKLMGYQMAMAYTGTTFLPPLFGLLATKMNINLFPIVICVFLVLMIFNSERIIAVLKKNS